MEKKTETEETVTPRSLETVRLLIRPFQEEDADAFFACCQNPNLGNNAGWAPHKTIEESREILQNVFIGQENIWAMILKDAQQLIGSIGIVPDPKRENPQVRMLGYWLDEAHWGKGYMTEAVQAILNYGFNELQLSLITANCYPHNKRSQQVLERNGFIYEGVLHQAELTYNGNIFDHLCYYLPNICQPAPQDYDEILEVWEASVRHTHHFLTEEHIQFYKPLVRDHYLPAVELFVIRNVSGKIAAFMGLSDELIEMLFVHPDEQGKGYGKRLIEYAKDKKYMDKVRKRAGIPGVDESIQKYANDEWKGKENEQETLRQFVRQERQIEFYLEGQRFWDLRRWKIAEKLDEPFLCWNIEGASVEEFFKAPQPNMTLTNHFYKSQYLLPISASELEKTPQIIQNPFY